MKEPLPALLTTLVYDGMDAACTASTESTSLLHHHAWHTVRGAEKLRRTRTDAVAQLEQLAQRSQRCDASIPTCRGCARVLGLVAWAAGPRVSYCIRVGQDLHPYPLGA